MSCGGNDKNGWDRFLGNVGGNFQNVFSAKPLGKYLTGARVTLKINRQLVGFAFGITWKIDTLAVENNTIDDYMPHELIPTRIHVTGTISALHIPGQSPTKKQIQSNVLSFLFHQYVTIEARDSQTDEILFYTSKAVITSRQETINSGEIAKMTLNFTAIGWRDELEPTKPKGIDKGTTGDSNEKQSY